MSRMGMEYAGRSFSPRVCLTGWDTAVKESCFVVKAENGLVEVGTEDENDTTGWEDDVEDDTCVGGESSISTSKDNRHAGSNCCEEIKSPHTPHCVWDMIRIWCETLGSVYTAHVSDLR